MNSFESISKGEGNGYSPYGKKMEQQQNSFGIDTCIKDKYFKYGEDNIREHEEIHKLKSQQRKIQKKNEEIQRVNDKNLKDYMKNQRKINTQMQHYSLNLSIKDQINASIERSNKSKLCNNLYTEK